MDANFRLCRKSKAAKSLSRLDPLLSGIFLAQAAVDDYVSRHEKSFTMGDDYDTVCHGGGTSMLLWVYVSILS